MIGVAFVFGAMAITAGALVGVASPPARAAGTSPAASAPAADAWAGFHLVPPAPRAESIGERDDFPWLEPVPGSTLLVADHGMQGLDVTTPEDDEAHIVGTQTLTRTYARPTGLADDTLLRVYAGALRNAGWTVMAGERRATGGALLVAHYAASGRDLWIRLVTARDQYSMAMADVGDDLGHLLSRACRVTVYGIEFTVDRPDLDGPAEPVLMELRQLLRSDRSMRLQVVVHLDASDVPNDPPGARRLSQQRAEAIRTWLARHRVDTDRIVTTGAGADHPLEPSDSEPHRARNRRVELVRAHCDP
ncbi:MAG TPA: OmpA family protein [Burkholderiaceae bacterium]|nr:OmpA family protein [Burkholderiaceae bacterium]